MDFYLKALINHYSDTKLVTTMKKPPIKNNNNNYSTDYRCTAQHVITNLNDTYPTIPPIEIKHFIDWAIKNKLLAKTSTLLIIEEDNTLDNHHLLRMYLQQKHNKKYNK